MTVTPVQKESKKAFSYSCHTLFRTLLSGMQYLFPALCVALLVGIAYRIGGLYPFGKKSLSWCDMDTQIVPLLCNLKDVLSGKASLFLSFENGGGMNFLGVFFYYLSSPFHLLVAFVDKAEMMQFVNVLVLLKLMAAATTAYVYFRHTQCAVPPVLALALSLFYALCGYGAIYFQILLWLDMLYLFPLLLLGVERLIKQRKPYLYLISLTACFFICFYLSYMCVILLILFVGAHLPLIKSEHRGEICLQFAAYSVAALLLSACAVLPLLSQWASSARTSVSFWQTLKTAPLQGNISTTLPVLMQSLSLLPFFFFRKPQKEDLPYFAVALLVFLPAVIEPFNVIWQTGTYMAFPIRYGFITNFMLLVPVARALSPRASGMVSLSNTACSTPKNSYNRSLLSTATLWGRRILPVAAAILAVITLVQFFRITQTFLTENKVDLSSFSRKLWGSDQSLKLYAKYFGVTLTVAAILFLLCRTHLLKSALFGAAMLLFSFTSGYYTATAFLSYGSAQKDFYDKAIATQSQQQTLSEGLNFYRIKQTRKNYYVNYTGAAGYGSFSTYTSLTSKNGMDLAKILGYESNWMEIGSHNGTIFTDALLCTRYITYYTTVGQDANGKTLYGYGLKKTPYYLPLGIVTPTNLTHTTAIFRDSRTEYQQRLFESVFPNTAPLLVEYPYSYLQNVAKSEQGEETVFRTTAKQSQSLIVYEIDVEGKQTLYLDVFHNAAFQLSQPTFETLSVKVDGRTVAATFPTGDNNGFLTLGTFENERVTVELVLKKTLRTTSFGVFGIKEKVLSSAVSSATTANLKAEGNRITGGVNASEGDYLFLSLPYEQGYKARVNGKTTPLFCTLDGFSAIALQQGSNEIVITYRPQGLLLGVFATLCGVGFLAILVAFSNSLRYNKIMGAFATYAVTAISALCVAMVYVIPILVYYIT